MKTRSALRTIDLYKPGAASIARDLTERVCKRLEAGSPFNTDLIAAFRQAPTVELFDRLTAFRSEPMDAEYRAAIERVERGEYGRCTTCGGAIGRAQLREVPLLRYCSACLRGLALNAVAQPNHQRETHLRQR